VAGSKPRTLPDLTCEVCGKTYRPGQASHLQTSRYCSRPCKDIGITLPRVEVECLTCHEMFTTYIAKNGEQVRTYCSFRCRSTSRVIHGVGRSINGYPVTMHVSGYLMVTVPGRKGGHQMMEHRYVMEQALGRELLAEEQVHHLNHIKTDNRIENLALLSPRAHAQETRMATGMRANAKAARIRELEAELIALRQQVSVEGSRDEQVP